MFLLRLHVSHIFSLCGWLVLYISFTTLSLLFYQPTVSKIQTHDAIILGRYFVWSAGANTEKHVSCSHILFHCLLFENILESHARCIVFQQQRQILFDRYTNNPKIGPLKTPRHYNLHNHRIYLSFDRSVCECDISRRGEVTSFIIVLDLDIFQFQEMKWKMFAHSFSVFTLFN